MKLIWKRKKNWLAKLVFPVFPWRHSVMGGINFFSRFIILSVGDNISKKGVIWRLSCSLYTPHVGSSRLEWWSDGQKWYCLWWAVPVGNILVDKNDCLDHSDPSSLIITLWLRHFSSIVECSDRGKWLQMRDEMNGFNVFFFIDISSLHSLFFHFKRIFQKEKKLFDPILVWDFDDSILFQCSAYP